MSKRAPISSAEQCAFLRARFAKHENKFFLSLIQSEALIVIFLLLFDNSGDLFLQVHDGAPKITTLGFPGFFLMDMRVNSKTSGVNESKFNFYWNGSLLRLLSITLRVI